MISLLRSLSTIVSASSTVFRERVYIGMTVVSSLALFGLYLLVPVWLVPGNTLAFEMTQLSLLNAGLLGALALATGVLLSFEVFAFRRTRASGARAAGEGSVGLLASLAGGILASASCGCGIGILLGVVGLGGGTLFVVAHQTLIVVVMLVVVVIGLYFSARKAAGICATCSV